MSAVSFFWERNPKKKNKVFFQNVKGEIISCSLFCDPWGSLKGTGSSVVQIHASVTGITSATTAEGLSPIPNVHEKIRT